MSGRYILFMHYENMNIETTGLDYGLKYHVANSLLVLSSMKSLRYEATFEGFLPYPCQRVH